MSNSEQTCLKNLIDRLREGDRQAFQKLYEMYHQDIYAYGFSLLKSKHLAEDLIQDVFIKIWTRRESLNSDLSFRSYIFTITRNMTFDTLVKASTQTKLKEAIFYKSPKKSENADYQLLESNFEGLKKRALEDLTPSCRLAFEMSRNEGKTYKQIGKELGISENTVKNQISTALTDIRGFLKKHGDIAFIWAVVIALF